MIYYIYAVFISIVLFLIIQYYVNTYGTENQKQILNRGNNKTYLCVGFALLCTGSVYIYKSNILTNINSTTSSSISLINDSPMSTESLKVFESEFINSIKNQEVEVGDVPF